MNKKGSAAVFLCVILTGLAAVTLTLIYAAHYKAVESCVTGVSDLAADSIMSEYDCYIQRDYGIFLLAADDRELSRKMRGYMNYSLSSVKGAKLKKASVSSSRYSTVNTEAVRKQILRSVKYTGFSGRRGANAEDKRGTAAMEMHELRDGPTIVSLPSLQLPEKSLLSKAESLAGRLSNPSAFFREGSGRYMLGTYILSRFNNNLAIVAGDHFFRNEVEYIIAGKLSDEANMKKTDRILCVLRTPLNLSHIYADPEKRAAVIAAAEIITPGPLGSVTQAGIASAWAAAEAVNDVKLLHEGYKVPIQKDASSWATDLDGVIKGLSGEMIRPDVNRGVAYDGYLRMLLYIMDDDIKTARILDLIQINMRRNYDRDFLITECSTGISADVQAGRFKLSFDKIY